MLLGEMYSYMDVIPPNCAKQDKDGKPQPEKKLKCDECGKMYAFRYCFFNSFYVVKCFEKIKFSLFGPII